MEAADGAAAEEHDGHQHASFIALGLRAVPPPPRQRVLSLTLHANALPSACWGQVGSMYSQLTSLDLSSNAIQALLPATNQPPAFPHLRQLNLASNKVPCETRNVLMLAADQGRWARPGGMCCAGES